MLFDFTTVECLLYFIWFRVQLKWSEAANKKNENNKTLIVRFFLQKNVQRAVIRFPER